MIYASYMLQGRYIPYLLLIMIILISFIALLLSAAIDANPIKIFLYFTLIALFCLIVIVSVWLRKIQYKPKAKKTTKSEYSLD